MQNANFIDEQGRHDKEALGSFIVRLKMNYAFAILVLEKLPEQEVALAVGYKDTRAFREDFKQLYGFFPEEAHLQV